VVSGLKKRTDQQDGSLFSDAITAIQKLTTLLYQKENQEKGGGQMYGEED